MWQDPDREVATMVPIEERPTGYFVRYVVGCWALVVLFAMLTVYSQGISRIFAAVAAVCGLVGASILMLATRRLVGSRTASDGRPPSDRSS